MPTIKDVAEKAGVTVTTVSRVLNNRGYISDKTRKRVYEVMREINYQPNEVARALTKKNTNIIGVIVPSIIHPYFSMCLHYFEKHASAAGFKLMVCNSQRERQKEIEYIEMLKSNQVAGIILCTRNHDLDNDLQLNLPVVTFERSISNDLPAVLCDNYRGGVLAAEHLMQHGCRKLGLIQGSIDVALPADERCAAFVNTCQKHGLNALVYSTKERNFNERSYHALIEKMLDEHPDIDGVFATSDLIAAQVLQVCGKRGIQVPQNINLVGFDDVELAKLTTPPLTTIHQPVDEMCKYAVSSITSQLHNEMVPIKNVLPVTLIKRGSVSML